MIQKETTSSAKHLKNRLGKIGNLSLQYIAKRRSPQGRRLRAYRYKILKVEHQVVLEEESRDIKKY